MPRPKWNAYVWEMVDMYPELKRELEALKSQSGSGFGSTGHSGKISDPTADLALRELDPILQRKFEAVDKAINTVRHWKHGAKQLEIVRLVHWKKSHTIYGAGRKVGMKQDLAYLLHSQFMREVAKNFGLIR